jgi:hypothetical protein
MKGYQPVILDTFVIRLWREPSRQTWRGQIVHLPDQESAYFASFEQALAFIARFTPEVRPAPDSGEHSAAPEAASD